MTATDTVTLTPEAALARSEHFYADGDMQQAEEYCRESLRLRPDCAEAFHLLGRIMHRRGRSDIAIAVLWKAIASEPDNAQYRARLGKMFLEVDSLDEAIATLETARALDPRSGKTLHLLGFALIRQGDMQAAEHCFHQAIDVNPSDPRAHFHLANLYESSGRSEHALAAFKRAVEIDPSFRSAHLSFAGELELGGRRCDAKQVLQSGLAIIGYEPEIAYMLAALAGDTGLTRAPDDYVSQHFDKFASFFDEQLLQTLNYQAPQLIADAVHNLWSSHTWTAPSLEVLDLGCGTGLCGTALRSKARRLTGVDLSPAMLEKARARQVYDDLLVAEITTFLSNTSHRYDLIVAADVLVYFGDLLAVFASVAHSLAPGGVFVMTVERSDTLEFQLLPSGRYAHTEAYLQRMAARSELQLVTLEECTLRLEYGNPVPGYLGTFRKLPGV